MATEKDPKTSYTPSADSKAANDTTTHKSATDELSPKKGLGAGAIIGITAGSLALLAGAFAGGVAVGNSSHPGAPGFGFSADGPLPGQMHDGQRGVDPDGDNWTGQNKQFQGGQQGPMNGGQRGVDPDGDNWTGQNQQMPQQPQSPNSTATPQTQTN